MLPFPSCILLFTRRKISSEKWLGLTDDKNAELCRHTCEFNISHLNICEDWSSKINKRSLSGNANVSDYFPRLPAAFYPVCPKDLDPCGLVTLSCLSPKLKHRQHPAQAHGSECRAPSWWDSLGRWGKVGGKGLPVWVRAWCVISAPTSCSLSTSRSTWRSASSHHHTDVALWLSHFQKHEQLRPHMSSNQPLFPEVTSCQLFGHHIEKSNGNDRLCHFSKKWFLPIAFGISFWFWLMAGAGKTQKHEESLSQHQDVWVLHLKQLKLMSIVH